MDLHNFTIWSLNIFEIAGAEKHGFIDPNLEAISLLEYFHQPLCDPLLQIGIGCVQDDAKRRRQTFKLSRNIILRILNQRTVFLRQNNEQKLLHFDAMKTSNQMREDWNYRGVALNLLGY